MEVTAEDLRGQGCLVPTPLSHFLPVGGVRGYVNHLVLHLLPTQNCLDVVLLRVQLQRVKLNSHHSLDVVLLRTHATNGHGQPCTQTPSTGLRHPSFNHCRI